jgi:Na+/melibiose symporter-like transporter
VPSNDLVTANGRIQASFSAAMIAGPLLAGALISAISVETILLIDAASFLFSALFLSLVRRSFNQLEREEKRTSIRQDIGEGLRYVWSHPVLRSISIMMALVNFVGSTLSAQLVLFAKERLHADDSELGILFAGEAAGVVILALVAGTLRKRFSFSTVALGSLMVSGVICVVFAYLTNFWIALPLWTLFGGLGILFNINTGSLRQSIVPNDMLGRVISVAGVVAWSAIPLGTILGGIAIEQTGDVALVYAVIGGLITLIAFCFRFTALGHAERYLPPDNAAPSGES